MKRTQDSTSRLAVAYCRVSTDHEEQKKKHTGTAGGMVRKVCGDRFKKCASRAVMSQGNKAD